MTDNLLPAQSGHFLACGKFGTGKTRIHADVMRTLLNDALQNLAALSDDSDAASNPDGETRDEQ